MSLMDWKGLPDTSTPLNPNNLENDGAYLKEIIDGIVESGSNNNGTYIMLSNGTLICTKQVTKVFTEAAQWGALYDVIIPCGNWAYPFISVPFVSGVLVESSGFVEGFRNVNSNGVEQVIVARPTNISASAPWGPVLDIVAIGRWK